MCAFIDRSWPLMFEFDREAEEERSIRMSSRQLYVFTVLWVY